MSEQPSTAGHGPSKGFSGMLGVLRAREREKRRKSDPNWRDLSSAGRRDENRRKRLK